MLNKLATRLVKSPDPTHDDDDDNDNDNDDDDDDDDDEGENTQETWHYLYVLHLITLADAPSTSFASEGRKGGGG